MRMALAGAVAIGALVAALVWLNGSSDSRDSRDATGGGLTNDAAGSGNPTAVRNGANPNDAVVANHPDGVDSADNSTPDATRIARPAGPTPAQRAELDGVLAELTAGIQEALATRPPDLDRLTTLLQQAAMLGRRHGSDLADAPGWLAAEQVLLDSPALQTTRDAARELRLNGDGPQAEQATDTIHLLDELDDLQAAFLVSNPATRDDFFERVNAIQAADPRSAVLFRLLPLLPGETGGATNLADVTARVEAAFVRLLDSPDAAVRLEAIRSLLIGNVSNEMLERLRTLLPDEPDPTVRAALLWAFRPRPNLPAGIIDSTLFRSLELDDAWDVRVEALHILCEHATWLTPARADLLADAASPLAASTPGGSELQDPSMPITRVLRAVDTGAFLRRLSPAGVATLRTFLSGITGTANRHRVDLIERRLKSLGK